LGGTVDDIEEVSLKRSSTNKSAVNIRLGQKVFGVGALHAASVLDADSLGNSLTDVLTHPLTDEGMGLLRHLRGGGQTGADGPNRFVGNGDVLPILLIKKLGGRGKLRSADIVGGAVLTLLLLLTNGEHDLEAGIEGDLNLLSNKLAVLTGHAEALSALGVANADPHDADILELRGADLAGVGALLLVDTAVLSTDGNVVTELRET